MKILLIIFQSIVLYWLINYYRHNKLKKSLFIIFFFYTSALYCQSTIMLGFRGELSYIYYKVDNKHTSNITIPFIQNFYFPIGLKLSESTIFEVRPGYMLADNNYEGIELGTFLLYSINQTNLFVGSGIIFHFNDNTDGNEGFYGNTIALLNMETGYSFTKKTSLILSFQYPLKSNYGFYGNTELARNIEHEVKFITKLGMHFWLN